MKWLFSNYRLVFLFCFYSGSLSIWANPGDVIWSYDALGTIYATPAVASDGTIFVAAEVTLKSNYSGRVCAVNSDGSQKWVIDGLEDWIDSAPTVGPNNRIYFGSWDGVLYAYQDNGNSYQQAWIYDTESSGITTSPALDDAGNIYFGTQDGILYSLTPQRILRWFHAENIESSPVIGVDGSVYFGSSKGWIYQLDSNGNEVNTFKAINPTGNLSESSVRIRTAPMLDMDGNIYFGSANTNLYCLDSELNLKWLFKTGDKVDSSPILGPNGNVYFASRDGYLYAISREGDFLWANFVGDVFYTSPVVDSLGNVYIAAFIGNSESALYAFNGDGDFLWSRTFSNLIDASLVINDDGILYLGSYNSNLYAVEAESSLASTWWPKFQRDLANTGQALTGVAPEILEHPKLTVAQTGGNFSLSVKAAGTEPLVYQWLLNGIAFSANGSEIELNGVMLSDGGYYEVVVINDLGLITSAQALVTIVDRPYLDSMDQINHLVLPFTRPVYMGSEIITIEAASEDLLTWSEATVSEHIETLTDDVNLIRAKYPIDGYDQALMRLRVENTE